MRRPLRDLADGNAGSREITPEAARALGASVARFGDLSGLVWNRRTGRLVCGHERKAALERAGAVDWFEAGGQWWIEHPETRERFAVRIVDWDEEEEVLARFVANSPHVQGVYTAGAAPQLRPLQEAMGPAFAALCLGPLLADLRTVAAAAFQKPDGAGGPGSAAAGPKPDGLWFYVEFYGEEARFAALKALLAPVLLTGHQMDGAAFDTMVRLWAAQAPSPGVSEG